MNPLEQQVATLLQGAPGEPPTRIDPDALLGHRPGRRLLPAVAAAAIVAIAVPVTVLATRDSGNHPSRPAPHHVVTTLPARDPRAAALQALRQLLDNAPLPAGAQRLGHGIPGLSEPFDTGSPNDLDRTRFFAAPSPVTAVLAYVRADVPHGMTEDSSGSSGGSNASAVKSVTFVTPTKLYLSYSVTQRGSGSAIRVDAQTIWVPNRPSWTVVPGSVTSAEVTVVRKALNKNQGGAPTVRGTFTGDAARQLAAAINALPSAAPEGMHSCPAILVAASDVIVFHSPTGVLRISREGGICAFDARITAPPSKRVAYVPGSAFTKAVLGVLDLPANYGMA
jgi:hypothetical protein